MLKYCKNVVYELFLLKNKGGLGTFAGVFLPSYLYMMGVVLYLRLGLITGQAGIINVVGVIALSAVIMVITGFSITSIVTNMQVNAGGAYYIISRSLGIRIGSIIGILLCIGQLASITLCITGFAVSLQAFLPQFSLTSIEVVTLVILGAITFISRNLAVRTQIFIFIVLLLSFYSIFSGSYSNIPEPILLSTDTFEHIGFWAAFGILYPAMTGIEIGMSMSGDLKNPSRSLSIGTIAAIIASGVVYISLAIFLHYNVPASLLVSQELIAVYVAKYGFLVVLGIWGATISSALGAILGTPRVMQAISKDGVLPGALSKGHGPYQDPRVGLILTLVLTFFLLVFTNIDQIIPMLTMICLVSYGTLNCVSFFESFVQNPSWRPSVKTPWWVSLIGAILCFGIMFLVNPFATFGVIILVMLGFYALKFFDVEGDWDDIRFSIYSTMARFFTQKLNELDDNAKSWRPNIICLSERAGMDESLCYFTESLVQGKGFMTYASVVRHQDLEPINLPDYQKQLEGYMQSNAIASFVHIQLVDDIITGLDQVIHNYGMGPLTPNTIVVNCRNVFFESERYLKMLRKINRMHRNVVLFRSDNSSIFKTSTTQDASASKTIDIWWSSDMKRNYKFSLALAYIMQMSQFWSGAQICIKTLVQDAKVKDSVDSLFMDYIHNLRITNLSFKSYLQGTMNRLEHINEHSRDTDFVLLGIRAQKPHETNKAYKALCLDTVRTTCDIPNIAYVIAGERISFEAIFS